MLHKIAFIVTLTIATCTLTIQADERVWTDIDGRKITGEYLRDDEAKQAIVLKVRDKEFTVPTERLSKEDLDWLANEKAAAEELAQSFKKLAGTTKSFAKSDTHPVSFHTYYPTTYSAKNLPPMIILFSPGGNGKSILNQFKDACEKLGWIGVGCDVFKNGVDAKILDPLFEELLPVIEKSIAHDPAQLYIGGFSGGGSRAANYTAKFKRPWKGVISCGGWLGKAYDLEYPKKIAIAWVNGDKDKSANSWITKDTDFLKRFRIKTETFHFPGGHKVAPPETLTKAMLWVSKNTKAE